MTLIEFIQVGVGAWNMGWAAFDTPLSYIDNYSLADLFLAIAFMSICGWFMARMVKGKGAKAPGKESDDIDSGESGGFFAEEKPEGEQLDEYWDRVQRENSEA